MPDGGSWPVISVVTPSYNQAPFLEECLRSVLLQGYPALELIVLDGGSDDGSGAIIGRYAPWLAFWRSARDDGQAAAIAEGFERSSGAILAWLNSDDCYRPGALPRVGRFFARHPRLAFASGDVYLTDAASSIKGRIYAIRPNRFLTANLGRHVWPQQGSFWRREVYQRVGGIDRSLRFCMDRDLFLRLTAAGPARRIPGPPLADFRQHEAAKSSTILHVAAAEGQRLIERYGHPRLRGRTRLLTMLWRFWYRPTGLRIRLHRTFGWEL
jgi:glycosyltransferase involved in cell wall biosynthesis